MVDCNIGSWCDPPRRVRLRKGSRLFFVPGLILAAMAVGGIAGGLMWSTGRELRALRALQSRGRFAEATLASTETFEDLLARSPFRTRVRALYAFDVAGVRRLVEQTVPAGAVPASRVTVVYASDDPGINRVRSQPIRDEEISRAEYWFWAPLKAGATIHAAFVFLVALPFAIVPGLHDIRRQGDLARHGIAAEAVITKIVRDGLGRRRAHYRFRTTDAVHKGKSLLGSAVATGASLHVGETTIVLFDPARPSRSALVLALDAVASIDEPSATVECAGRLPARNR